MALGVYAMQSAQFPQGRFNILLTVFALDEHPLSRA